MNLTVDEALSLAIKDNDMMKSLPFTFQVHFYFRQINNMGTYQKYIEKQLKAKKFGLENYRRYKKNEQNKSFLKTQVE